ncbi:hypothetical protein L7F22_033043 [Adiantum nelumboides]|nr:hypothetical protein [Adiantum nelumboides]
MSMAPKRGISKHLGRGTRSSSMALRSGSFKRRHVEQEASSRVVPRSTPVKKKGKWSKKCIFVDDEAQIEEGSNVIVDEGHESESEGAKDKDVVEEQSSEDDTQKKSKHLRQMGKQVPLGIMNDVLSQFYVKRRSPPPLVPLCRHVPHEAVRFSLNEASWLIPLFDTAAYLETMGSFLVSIERPSGQLMPITTQNLEEWDPIWIYKSAEFDTSLGREWQDLKGQNFLVWDGNHHLKTWWKRIKDEFCEETKKATIEQTPIEEENATSEQGDLGDNVPPREDCEEPLKESKKSKKKKKKSKSRTLVHESKQSGKEESVLQGVLSHVPESSMVRGGEGLFVILSLVEHFGKVRKNAARANFHVHRTWTVVCDVGYRHPLTGESVCDLTLGLFYRGDKPPHYDRDTGEEIYSKLFSAMRSFVVEELAPRSLIYGDPMRGGAKRTPLFLRKFDMSMAPKRGISKHGGRGTRSSSMALRSGSFKRRHVEQEASSRVVPRSTPVKKKGKWSKKCIFVDDEAQIEEGSNVIVDEGHESESEDKDVVEEQSSEDDTQKKSKHSRQMGKQVPLGIMNDVLSQFYVKCRSPPPLVPLCRHVPHEAVRFSLNEASWLIPLFDTAAYLETMGSFLVSIEGPSGQLMPITTQNLEEWDPIWIYKSAEFDKSLGREWQDLKGQIFLVWDGNHHLKTWLKRIKDVHYDHPKFHVNVRCQFISVEKRKQVELLFALDTTNAKNAARANFHVHRTWIVVCDVGYRHPLTGESVCDLTLGLIYRGDKPPHYDRDTGEEICPKLFSAMRSFVVEELAPRSLIYGDPMRGGAKRTPLVLRDFLDRCGEGEEVSGAIDMVIELLDVCDAIVDGANASAPVHQHLWELNLLVLVLLDLMPRASGSVEFENWTVLMHVVMDIGKFWIDLEKVRRFLEELAWLFELPHVCDAVDGADASAPVGVILLVLALDQMLRVLILTKSEELKVSMQELV